MKKEIHPEYREVLFHDTSVDEYFLIPSTLSTDQTREWEDGNTYPYCPLDVSSASHPFYTGKQKIIDTGGRVERFKKRFSKNKPVVKEEIAQDSKETIAEVSNPELEEKKGDSAEVVEEITPEVSLSNEDNPTTDQDKQDASELTSSSEDNLNKSEEDTSTESSKE
ncbi:MAG: type B 50S ribosomal protein L31 [Gammaproteobacteria bacterium]|jgi:large subunit ribosomal protein L31|nr:MAG: type B 50S ribosomal protein L31 [Gammaproteobacteria bacterium]|tara:strand:- start:999 stop:1496 length:498 start_codon:yes stop_codon:yes gene_type:complete